MKTLTEFQHYATLHPVSPDPVQAPVTMAPGADDSQAFATTVVGEFMDGKTQEQLQAIYGDRWASVASVVAAIAAKHALGPKQRPADMGIGVLPPGSKMQHESTIREWDSVAQTLGHGAADTWDAVKDKATDIKDKIKSYDKNQFKVGDFVLHNKMGNTLGKVSHVGGGGVYIHWATKGPGGGYSYRSHVDDIPQLTKIAGEPHSHDDAVHHQMYGKLYDEWKAHGKAPMGEAYMSPEEMHAYDSNPTRFKPGQTVRHEEIGGFDSSGKVQKVEPDAVTVAWSGHGTIRHTTDIHKIHPSMDW